MSRRVDLVVGEQGRGWQRLPAPHVRVRSQPLESARCPEALGEPSPSHDDPREGDLRIGRPNPTLVEVRACLELSFEHVFSREFQKV